MKDEFELFRQHLNGVTPLKQDHIEQISPYLKPTEAQLARREAASRELEDETAPLSQSEPKSLSPDDLVSYKKSGIQEGVFKKLRLGKYPIQARLDLHKMRTEEAKQQILRFIRQSQQRDCRCVLIIHGKGVRSNPPARMKSYVSHWLPQLNDVLAIHTALPAHGGYGALYVLLRKNPERKIETRERHARRLS
ncbi:MAG: putative DNA endonuclease SmrA [Candidatus Celerinatantimonas neptuna]|nr:MAG: putative DNA endonuclease SmrA [Candidatus Celerinatantimonas neptuna]